jgi:hypothetical protein
MTRARKQIEMTSFQELDADELKNSVREMLVLMEALERKLFIKTLEYEMSRSGLSIRPYLIPLGIAAAYAEDLTPSEVGHLIRFFKINVPKAMSAVWRVLAGCPVLATGSELVTEWLLKTTMQEACDRNELRT